MAFLPLLLLNPSPARRAPTLTDANTAALAIGRFEIAEVRRTRPLARFSLTATRAEPTKPKLTGLRDRLGLSLREPRPGPDVVTLDFGAVRRLPKGRLAMDASVHCGPRGGFRAHDVVDPTQGPFGTVLRRTAFLRY